jgi:hypothetical protein
MGDGTALRRVPGPRTFVVVALVGLAFALLLPGSPAQTPAHARRKGVAEAPATGIRPVSGEVLRVPARGAVNLGFCGGDDWEPEIWADPNSSYVYAIIAHYTGDRTCDPASGNPQTIYFRTSSDGGRSFGPLTAIPTPPGLPYAGVVDVVVTSDPVTGAVYASFLGYFLPDASAKDTDVIVAKSTDHGHTWTSRKVNGPECTACDHPWTAAYDGNVYVVYASGPSHYLSRSADGGHTWKETNILEDTHVAFPEGAVLDAAHNPWFAWGDCFGSCTGNTAAVYQVSRTVAGTSNTTFAAVAEGSAGPHCPPSVACGFAYWGPQDDIAIDAAGNLYLVWQDSDSGKPGKPPIVQLSSCSTGSNCATSANWHHVGRVDDKTATGCAEGACYALYPRVEGGSAGRISVMWMDDRLGSPIDHNNGWNVWYRTSTDGGRSWSGPSARVSTYDRNRSESHPNGFEFPYGDYQGIDLTAAGKAAMIWGEGHNYTGGPSAPGHVLYRSIPA